MQLLRVYVDPTVTDDSLPDPLLLPGTLRSGFRGRVQSWWDLTGTWATATDYGIRLYDLYMRIVNETIAADAAAACGGSAAAAPPAAPPIRPRLSIGRVRFAIFTVSLPEWTPDEAVAQLAALGYDGVEWRVTDQAPHDGDPGFWWGNKCTWPLDTLLDDAPHIRARQRGRGPRDPEPRDLCLVLRARCRCACDGRRRRDRCSEHPRAGAALRRHGAVRRTARHGAAAFDAVVALAARHGVRALVETHMQTILPSASAAARSAQASSRRTSASSTTPATWCTKASSTTAWASRSWARTSRTCT